jgi:sensor histidine kinase YesM
MIKKNVFIMLVHIGYWLMYAVLFFSFFVMLFASGQREFVEFWEAAREFAVATIPFALVTGIIGFYGAYSMAYEKGFLQKRWKLFAALFGLINMAGVALGFGAYYLLFEGFQIYLSWETFTAQAILMAFIVTINFIIGSVLRGFIQSFKEIELREELHRRTTEVELELVKAHLQPHFLFNTINNIDAMLVKDPQRASEYLNKLSDILRYSLFDSDSPAVPLDAEIDYLQRYLDLQAIRTHVKNVATMSVSGDTHRLQVAPFVFMPFVENAFKHTTRMMTPGAIVITIHVDRDEVFFNCVNVIAHDDSEGKNDVGGIGNELMRKRLELIYGEQHQLYLHQTETHYHVELKLKCSVIPV